MVSGDINQRSLPSITVHIGEPRWNCQCKPETRCRLVVEIPPPAPKYRRIVWTIRRAVQVDAQPSQEGIITSGSGSSNDTAPTGEPTLNATVTTGTLPLAQSNEQTREVSVPRIETLDDEASEEDDGESEWESEEEIDELKDD